MYSISLPSDEHYSTPAVLGTVSYENAKQLWVGNRTPNSDTRRKLLSFYAFNSGGATIYLAFIDTTNAGVDNGNVLMILPVFQGSFTSRAIHGGERYERGLWVKAFTDVQLSAAAGNVMYYRADWSCY